MKKKRTFFPESHPAHPLRIIHCGPSALSSVGVPQSIWPLRAHQLFVAFPPQSTRKDMHNASHPRDNERVCLQMQQQEKRKRKKNNWNCPTTLMEKIKFNTKNKSLKRTLRYFHSVWHRGQNEHSWRESEKQQTRANTKHHFSGTQYTGRICWGQQTGVVNETESNLGQKLVCLSDFLV